jgi:hypothetical protein
MITSMAPQFVESVPKETSDGVLYISIRYSVVIHRCCCGCGREVTTKLSPTGWRLIYDGETASLSPSIGNSEFLCRSHYWILYNRVRWERPFRAGEVVRLRQLDPFDEIGDSASDQTAERLRGTGVLTRARSQIARLFRSGP